MRGSRSQPYPRAQVARLIEILTDKRQRIGSFASALAQRPCAATASDGWNVFDGWDEVLVLLEELGFPPTFYSRLKTFQEDARTMVVKLLASDGARHDPAFHEAMLKVFGDDFPTPGASDVEHTALQRARQDRAAYRLELNGEFIDGLLARLRSVPTVADDNGGQRSAGVPTSSERSSTRTRRQEKAKLLREAKHKLVVKYLEDEPSLRELTYENLSAALAKKGLKVNPAFLSRNLRDTKFDRGRARGNPHRAAAGKDEREGVAVDDAADLSEPEAWTMPDDPES